MAHSDLREGGSEFIGIEHTNPREDRLLFRWSHPEFHDWEPETPIQAHPPEGNQNRFSQE